MKRRLHLIALILFVFCFLYDLVVWGSLPLLPAVGEAIVVSANREAPLAATYIGLGRLIDGAVPVLQSFGEGVMTDAIGAGFERIRGDSTVAIDLIFNTTWNAQHRWLKTMYWATPFLLLLTAGLWTRRPRQVRAFGRR
ncbi:MAG: hypothetical protein ABIR62_13565 [Dokdonella sp.]|uniref:hypothetical protein n=1 Tax=Dokdonella sp. TaxID=2291710 RepID=UPI0032674965